MSKTTMALLDGKNILRNLTVEDNGVDGFAPYHLEDSVQRANLISAIQGISTGLATVARQDLTITAIQAINTGLATATKQDTMITALNNLVGTSSSSDPVPVTALQLPTSLGAKTAAGSLSVTLATDGLFFTMQTTANNTLDTINTRLGGTLKCSAADASGAALQTTGVNVTGTLSAVSNGTTNPTTGISGVARVRGDFNINVVVSSDFSGSYVIERKFTVLGGTYWQPLTAIGTALTFNAPMSESFSEPVAGVDYRIRVTALTAGTIVEYRICQ